jgi:hypothetical protein
MALSFITKATWSLYKSCKLCNYHVKLYNDSEFSEHLVLVLAFLLTHEAETEIKHKLKHRTFPELSRCLRNFFGLLNMTMCKDFFLFSLSTTVQVSYYHVSLAHICTVYATAGLEC